MAHSTYTNYLGELSKALDSLDLSTLTRIEETITELFMRGGTLLVAGNGGSAATASHMACDFGKTVLGKDPLPAKKRLRCIALTDNLPLMTAYGNDTSYKDVFAEPLKTLAREGDALLVISASGNSPNVVAALEAAKEIGLKSLALLGFSGGKSLSLADISLVVPSANYGVVEDAHSVLMHMLTARLRDIVAEAQPR